MRSAETPAHLLLAMDLWDRSARSLLDDNNRVLKVTVSIELTRPGLECVKAPPKLRRWLDLGTLTPQVCDVLNILRDVATGLVALHMHKARPPHRVVPCLSQRGLSPGLGPPPPHLQRGRAHPRHICNEAGPTLLRDSAPNQNVPRVLYTQL
jgi:hypothetical protein